MVTARDKGENVWSSDATNKGVTYSGEDSLEIMEPIFPKLWRRLNSYSRDRDVANPDDLSEFLDFLNSLREEQVVIISQQQTTRFDNVLEINGNVIKMTVLPEDIIIVSN